MDFHKSRLDQDLMEKLNMLDLILQQPALHVLKRFEDEISSIDANAERELTNDECPDELKQKANEVRLEFARILGAVETRLQEKLTTVELADSLRDFKSLKERVQGFLDTPLGEQDDIDDVEDRYLDLALEAVAQRNELQKRIFDNQTIFYLKAPFGENRLGTLVHLRDCCLTRAEIKFLR